MKGSERSMKGSGKVLKGSERIERGYPSSRVMLQSEFSVFSSPNCAPGTRVSAPFSALSSAQFQCPCAVHHLQCPLSVPRPEC